MMFKRVERPLDRAHGVERRLSMLGGQVFHLALAHAVLAGTGAIHRQRPLDQAFEEGMDALDLCFVVHVDQQSDVEITVADMADDRRQELAVGNVALGRGQAFGEPRHRNADIGRQRFVAGAEPALRPISVVTRLPQPRAILALRRPIERPTAQFPGDFAETLRLFGDARVGAVKFDEQHRRFRQAELRIEIAGMHLQRVEKLDPRHRNAGLDGEDGRVARRFDGRKRTHAGGDRFGNAGKAQREFGDDAERAFRSDDQAGEIVARG